MVVLDTHAWIWWSDDPGRISPAARRAIESAGSVGVAAISCWEVGMLVLGGRLTLDREVGRWVQQALSRPGVEALSLTPKVALAAAMLERDGFVPDPADRLIYATSREVGGLLVTADARMREFDPRGTLW